jgi:epoxyqueuosine reductase
MDRPEELLTGDIAGFAMGGGASLVGFADLEGIAELPRGVVIAIRYAPEVLADPENMPNAAFAQEYARIGPQCRELSKQIAVYLEARGYKASAILANRREGAPDVLAAPFAHKTAGTRAGLGWVGRCALLVTYELGPGVRLGSVLTDAPLVVGEPVAESECGECTACVDACPGGALTGEAWYAGRPREEFFDAEACRRTCRERARTMGVEGGGCAVCMSVCPRRPRT